MLIELVFISPALASRPLFAISFSSLLLFSGLKKKQPSSSIHLDITLMYAIFRHTNCIDKHKNGWGQCPHINDIEIADDIERIRDSRNSLSHENTLEMDTKKFNESVLELIGVTCNGFLRIFSKFTVFLLFPTEDPLVFFLTKIFKIPILESTVSAMFRPMNFK